MTSRSSSSHSSSRPPSTSEPLSEFPDDPRLFEAMQKYMDMLDRGERPNRHEFVRAYPDIAGPLEDCLAGLDLVEKAGPADLAAAELAHRTRSGTDDVTPGQPLGDFRILREIGRGGMGIVYEAVQLSLGRNVALKVLPFAATFDAKHLQRFRNEAQAAAHLHHTNIVPVFAVGSERGVHFYAMQLIAGQSLAHVLRQVRKRAGKPVEEEEFVPATGVSTTVRYPSAPSGSDPAKTPTESPAAPETNAHFSLTLSEHRTSGRYFRDVAGLAIQAAEALEHAHQYGVIHRDIKPANLLVEPQGRLWVTDFGLAHFHTGTVLTHTGDLMGTLRYMSPEQASGQRIGLDHRTDIYALGATLYELVTLEPIWVGRTRHELLHQILQTEPRAPRAHDRAIPLELETILLKAIAKNPDERYRTAQEFAADLRRYLEDKPILARRPGPVERARKWARRHPAFVWAAVGLVALAMAGLAVNNQMIKTEQAKTAKALEREKERADDAKSAVDLLIKVSDEELGNGPSADAARRRLLQMALDFYQHLLEQGEGDADAKSQLAAVKERVRTILVELDIIQNSTRHMLVLQKSVQDDLALSADQRELLKELGELWVVERPWLFRGPKGPGGPKDWGPGGHHGPDGPKDHGRPDGPGGPKDRGPGGPGGPRGKSEAERKKIVEMAKATERDLEDVLTATQLRRLEQIDLQLAGPKIFFETKVIEALKLTAPQRNKIREIEAAVFAEMRPEHGPGGPGGGPPDGPDGPRPNRFEDAKRIGVERILAALTPEQRLRWRTLIGPTFQGQIMFPGGPPKKGPHD